MDERLLGVETEYALTTLAHDGRPLSAEEGALRLIRLAVEKLVHLPSCSGANSIFLPSGRLYIDSGMHPEFSPVECSNPTDVVRYILAGEQILLKLATELENDPRIHKVLLFKCNVDYSGARTTWGCHESYLHMADPKVLSQQIIPHLVSRIIYTGAGGFDPMSCGLEFVLSPRVSHLVCEVSSSSTSKRGIYHTKDESLCSGPYHRLHILCGESLCSQVAAWLKVATTSLVVAMVEAGLKPAQSVQLSSHLGAMRTFAHDPCCEAKVKSIGGENLTALMIQRRYLECAEAHILDYFMPSWAAKACRDWRAMLDQLENAPDDVTTMLDWAIKLALYKSYVERYGDIEWESLAHRSREYTSWQATTQMTGRSKQMSSSQHLNDLLKSLGLEKPVGGTNEIDIRREEMRTFSKLRCQLFEIDMRFGQLGQNGIFSRMDRTGVLKHHLSEISDNDIEDAMNNPPSVGRASLRGKLIQQLHSRNSSHNHDRYFCDWGRIIDKKEQRILDLSDPFVTSERWVQMPTKTNKSHLRHDTILRDISLVRRRMRIRRRQTGTQCEYRSGDRLRIVQGWCPEANRYVGQVATVTAAYWIRGDGQGLRLRLDVDDGEGIWRHQHVRPVDSFNHLNRR